MADQDRFEARLAAALGRYADEAPERSGLDTLVESVTARSQRRGILARLTGSGSAFAPGFGASRPALGLVWLLLAAALLASIAAGVAVVGGLLRGDELSVVPSPVTRQDESPLRPAATEAPQPEWAIVAADQTRPGVDFRRNRPDLWWQVASNGTSFVAVDWPADYAGKPVEDVTRVLRSADGITWDEVDQPWTPTGEPGRLLAAGSEYLVVAGCGSNQVFAPPSTCQVWRSADGVDWSETRALGDEFEYNHWEVSTVDALLAMNPPTLDNWEAPAAVILEFEERLVMLGADDSNEFRVASLASDDGITWTPQDPMPPFATLIDELDVGAWWGPWQCGFAVRDSTALAVLPSGDSHRGWMSDDGLRWEEIELDLPEDPMLAPNGQGTADLDATWGGCLTALSDGWAIASDAPNARATDVWLSGDGRHWTRLSVPEVFTDLRGRIRIAGDTLFLEPDGRSGMVVGRLRT